MTAIYPYGERVLIGPETARIEGVVTGCELRGTGYARVLYLISWWSDREHRCEWIDACEVERADESSPRARIDEEGL